MSQAVQIPTSACTLPALLLAWPAWCAGEHNEWKHYSSICRWDVRDTDVDTEGRPALAGYLLADQVRLLARWLLALADEADPHHTNGELIELSSGGCVR